MKMRLMPVMLIALVLSISAPSFAQEWIEFASRQDRFTCNFPTQPKITETTYKSLHGAELPARVYSATQGQSRYSVTVVDYNPIERILTEKAKTCPVGAEPCIGGGVSGAGHWRSDTRGAIVQATWQLMQRDAKVTNLVWNFVDLVEGHQLQLTNNADKSRTFAGIYMHENKLYIIEGTVPAGYPEPGLFQQSLGWLDENGVGLRYQNYYSNNYPAPPRVNRTAGQGLGQGRIDAPGATTTPAPPK
jgi:hypothetical protein